MSEQVGQTTESERIAGQTSEAALAELLHDTSLGEVLEWLEATIRRNCIENGYGQSARLCDYHAREVQVLGDAVAALEEAAGEEER